MLQLKYVPIIVLMTLMCIGIVSAQEYWVDNPYECPDVYESISCPGDPLVCGVNGGTNCYAPPFDGPPEDNESSNAGDMYNSSFAGGFLVDCYDKDASEPYCDNSGDFWCNRNNTCYAVKYRQTICIGGSWANDSGSDCGICRTDGADYLDCVGDDVCESRTGVTDCDVGNYTSGNNNQIAEFCGCECDSGYGDCDEGGPGNSNGCEVNFGVTNCDDGDNNNIPSCGSCVCDTGWEDCDASGEGSGNGCEYEVNEVCGTNAKNVSGCAGCTCNTNYYSCDDGIPENGCEVQDGTSCSVGAVSGTWDCSVGAGGCYTVVGGTEYTCTCVVDDQDIATTGDEVVWSGTEPMLYITQHGAGPVINATMVGDGEFIINSSGPFWNGVLLNQTGNGTGGGNESWNEGYADQLYVRYNNISNQNVNSSDWWDNLNSYNITQFLNNGGVLTLSWSWLVSFVDNWFGSKTTDDLTEGSTNLYDNKSWNETHANELYMDINTVVGNSTEEIQDAVGSMAGDHLTYTDGSNDLSVDDDWYNSASDVIGGFTDCSGTKYLGADGACHDDAVGGGGAAKAGQEPWLYNTSTEIIYNETHGNLTYYTQDLANDTFVFDSDTTNWDKDGSDDFTDISNFTGTLTPDKICTYDGSEIDCDYTDQIGEGGSGDVYVNETGDMMTGNLTLGTDVVINDDDSGSYIRFENGKIIVVLAK